MTDTPVLVWVLRLLWAGQPLLTGAVAGDVWADQPSSLRLLATLLAWLVWAIGLGALAIPRREGIVAARVAVPCALALAVAAGVQGAPGGLALAGLITSGAAFMLVVLPEIGNWLLDGSSYGAERRLGLTVPASLQVGPVPIAHVAVVLGAFAGPLLLADQRWLLGGVGLLIGWPVAAACLRALVTLTNRFVVLVPAGLVLHDHLTLAEPTLFRTAEIARLEPAREGTEALDLTAAAPGTPLELQLHQGFDLHLTPPRGESKAPVASEVSHLLFAPNRPGTLLAEHQDRSWAEPRHSD